MRIIRQDACACAADCGRQRVIESADRDAVVFQFLTVRDEGDLRQPLLICTADIRHAVGAALQHLLRHLGGTDKISHVIAAQLQAEGAPAISQTAAGSTRNRRLILLDADIAVCDIVIDPCAHLVCDRPDITAAILPIDKRDADTAGIHPAAPADHRHVGLHLRHLGKVALELSRDSIRALDRRIRRELDLHIEAALIRARHVLHPDPAERHHRHEKEEGDGDTAEELLLMPKAPGDGHTVCILHPLLDLLYRAPELRIRDMYAVLEKFRCQHRCQREGDEQGKERSKNDRETELLKKLPRHARHESDREENHHITERDRNGGHADLHTPCYRRLLCILPLGQMAVNILQNNDRVIDKDPYTERHPHERHHIEGKACHVHDEERGNERRRDRDDDRRRRAPSTQEEEEHEPRRDEPFDERRKRIMERRAHVVRRIIHYDELIVRILRPHILQDLHHTICRRDEIGIAVLIDRDPDGILSIDARKARHPLVLTHDLPHCGDRDHRAISAGEMDLTDILHRIILRRETDLRLARIRVGRARRSQLILLLQSGNDIIHRDAVVGELVAVHLHRDLFASSPVQLHIRHTVCLREIIREGIIRHGIHLIQRMARQYRQIDDRRRIHITLFYNRIIRIIRQLSADTVHLLRSIDRRRIRIRIKIQLQRHIRTPRARLRRDVLHIRHRRQRILQRLRDLLLHRLRVRAIIAHRHDDIGHIDIRIQLHTDAPIAVQSKHHEKQHDHKNADRVRHGIPGQIE